MQNQCAEFVFVYRVMFDLPFASQAYITCDGLHGSSMCMCLSVCYTLPTRRLELENPSTFSHAYTRNIGICMYALSKVYGQQEW